MCVFKNSENGFNFLYVSTSYLLTKFTLTKVLEMSVQLRDEARQMYFYSYRNTNIKWL